MRLVVTGGVVAALAGLIAGVLGLVFPRTAVPATVPYFGMAYGNTLAGMSDADLRRALDDAVDLGMSTVRMDLGWNDVQPDGPGSFTWEATDRVVDAARRRGLALIMVVAYAPRWAQAPGCPYVTCPPADPTAIGPFAREAAQRYADRVLAWEIWNEPNVAGFWGPQVDPAAYTELLRTASHAIRTVDPDATVVLGGLASVQDTATSVSAPAFLDEVAAAGGLTAVTGIGFHPYTFPLLPRQSAAADGSWAEIDDLRAVLSRHGFPGLPVWLTEYGAPTGGAGRAYGGRGPVPPGTTHVTEEQQARIAADAVDLVRADPGIVAMAWYSDRDLDTGSPSDLDNFGLRRTDGTAKPAYERLREALVAGRTAG
ncbi:Endo-1,4-beta-xylanase, GH35 family [Pseudonocardia thermophila]|uniref:Endo-1,4-beta-xylanase, GH35 family n=1 Tax=Pseudonocardia thermophila TaxID=1848 RepID=A0A1M6YU31_PSETH|nr:cellulase family glycosylhydrolase [Pseudonocardia thermophila]SHL21844.1 Endo-1,4-beta-xylanase, GH35 family [Pseudonocardia thermophila]